MRRIAPDSDRARGWDGVDGAIIGAARDGLGLRRMGLTVESSPGEGLGRGCGASSARRGM